MPPSKKVYNIQVADEVMVFDCKYLGVAKGNSNHGGWIHGEVGLENSQNQALEKAVDMGATHVIWKNSKKYKFSKRAKAKAYSCENRKGRYNKKTVGQDIDEEFYDQLNND